MALGTPADAPGAQVGPSCASVLPSSAKVAEPSTNNHNMDSATVKTSSGDEEVHVPNGEKKKKKKKKKKPKNAAKLGGEVDLAFPTESDVKHPDFELDHRAMTANMYPFGFMEMYTPDVDPLDYFRSIEMPSFADCPTIPARVHEALASHPPLSKRINILGEIKSKTRQSPRRVDVAAHIPFDSPLAAASVAASAARRVAALAVAARAEGETDTDIMLPDDQTLFPGGPDQKAFLGFGGSDDGAEPCAFILADMYARLYFRGHPMYDRPLRTEPHISQIPVRMIQTPRRGRALVATRSIPAGAVFLREPPLLVVLKKLDALTVANMENITSMMHPKVAAAFDSLHNCKPYTGPLVSNRHGILRTNGFAAGFEGLGDTGFTVVMQIMSRANHSCRPNTTYNWDWRSFQGKFTAKRDIVPGEEITVSYIDENQPTGARRKELKTKYFFICTCERCEPA